MKEHLYIRKEKTLFSCIEMLHFIFKTFIISREEIKIKPTKLLAKEFETALCLTISRCCRWNGNRC